MYASRPRREQEAREAVTLRNRHSLLRLRYLALVIICGWAAFDFLHTERPQLSQLQTQNRQLSAQLGHMRAEQQSLEKQKQQLNSPSYIEKYATEHQNLVMPNQVPFDLQHSSQ